jgi:hypothetical protein
VDVNTKAVRLDVSLGGSKLEIEFEDKGPQLAQYTRKEPSCRTAPSGRNLHVPRLVAAGGFD